MIVEALKLIPDGYMATMHVDTDGASFELYALDEEELTYRIVAGVESTPPDLETFVIAVLHELHARFDPAYDACDWNPRG